MKYNYSRCRGSANEALLLEGCSTENSTGVTNSTNEGSAPLRAPVSHDSDSTYHDSAFCWQQL